MRAKYLARIDGPECFGGPKGSGRPKGLRYYILILAITLGAGADSQPARRDADLMKQKVATINRLGERPQKERRRTTVTEKELNAYLALESLEDLPKGVVNPTVSILGAGRLSGRAVVDLDAVRKESPPKSL